MKIGGTKQGLHHLGHVRLLIRSNLSAVLSSQTLPNQSAPNRPWMYATIVAQMYRGCYDADPSPTAHRGATHNEQLGHPLYPVTPC